MKNVLKWRPVRVAVVAVLSSAFACAALERPEVEAGIRRAATFFRESVSTEGGYLWAYSEDLKLREGENVADDRTVWVQPPGTPTVGLAFLRAWRATRDAYCLDAAKAAGLCLVRGQLRSGGWPYAIPFDAERRAKLDLRTEPASKSKSVKRYSVLDDNTTQDALRFLVLLDEALDFRETAIHEAAQYGLAALLKVQFPNGAFPQVFMPDVSYDPAAYPVKPAEYPPEGMEPTHAKDYHVFYTFNDNLMRDVNRLFFAAWNVYSNDTYLAAAKRVGGFMKLAQLPEPQPAWAQQYDFQMRPCWARKFEPASVTGGETQWILRSLGELYLATGDASYLEPISKAVAYLKRSRLPDGRLARFYELRTNRPLYFRKDYQLTFSDADVPTHYSFKVDYAVDEAWLSSLATLPEAERQRQWRHLLHGACRGELSRGSVAAAEQALKALDAKGRWVTEEKLKSAKGERVRAISCEVFVKNLSALCAFLAPPEPR